MIWRTVPSSPKQRQGGWFRRWRRTSEAGGAGRRVPPQAVKLRPPRLRVQELALVLALVLAQVQVRELVRELVRGLSVDDSLGAMCTDWQLRGAVTMVTKAMSFLVATRRCSKAAQTSREREERETHTVRHMASHARGTSHVWSTNENFIIVLNIHPVHRSHSSVFMDSSNVGGTLSTSPATRLSSVNTEANSPTVQRGHV